MAASNKSVWRSNKDGATAPWRQRLDVAAGSSQAIKRGEICYATGDAIGGAMVPVSAATDNLHAFAIADEEQAAGDAARQMWFIIPRRNDVFEFALDAATAIDFADELQINDSQTLKKSATDAIAVAVDVNYLDSGTTTPTISSVLCILKNAVAGLEAMPGIGRMAGDAA